MDRFRVTSAVARGRVSGTGGVVGVAAVLGVGVVVRAVAMVLTVTTRARRRVVVGCIGGGIVGLFGVPSERDMMGVGIRVIAHMQMATFFSVTISI